MSQAVDFVPFSSLIVIMVVFCGTGVASLFVCRLFLSVSESYFTVDYADTS